MSDFVRRRTYTEKRICTLDSKLTHIQAYVLRGGQENALLRVFTLKHAIKDDSSCNSVQS